MARCADRCRASAGRHQSRRLRSARRGISFRYGDPTRQAHSLAGGGSCSARRASSSVVLRHPILFDCSGAGWRICLAGIERFDGHWRLRPRSCRSPQLPLTRSRRPSLAGTRRLNRCVRPMRGLPGCGSSGCQGMRGCGGSRHGCDPRRRKSTGRDWRRGLVLASLVPSPAAFGAASAFCPRRLAPLRARLHGAGASLRLGQEVWT